MGAYMNIDETMNMDETINEKPISVDIYTTNDIIESVHVFVHGYALSKSESTTRIAWELAKKLNQKQINVTTYGDSLPVKTTIVV